MKTNEHTNKRETEFNVKITTIQNAVGRLILLSEGGYHDGPHTTLSSHPPSHSSLSANLIYNGCDYTIELPTSCQEEEGLQCIDLYWLGGSCLHLLLDKFLLSVGPGHCCCYTSNISTQQESFAKGIRSGDTAAPETN